MMACPPLLSQLANVVGLRAALAVIPVLALGITIATARSGTLYTPSQAPLPNPGRDYSEAPW